MAELALNHPPTKTTEASSMDMISKYDPKTTSPRWKRSGIWLVVVLLVLAGPLSGCKENRRRDPGDESMARAIATVNNEKISFEVYQNEYQLFLTQWDRIIKNDPQKKQAIKKLLLDRKIEEKLLDQEARRRGVTVDNNELSGSMNLMMALPDDGEGGMDGRRSEIDQGEWNRFYKRRLIHEKLIKREVLDKIRVTSSEMRAYYNQNRNIFRRDERVLVRHIALGNRSNYNRVRRLIQRRKDFVELVRQYSITPDRKADGLLGWVKRGILPKEFDDAIFQMTAIGSISPRNRPVQTQIGYHIFRLEGRKPAGLVSYRNAISEIRRRVIQKKQSVAYQDWLANLRAKSTIKIDETLLAAD